MKKILGRLFCILVAVCCFYSGGILTSQEMLQTLNVTGQTSLVDSFRQGVSDATNLDLAREYLQTHLPQIREASNHILQESGILSCFQTDDKGYQIRFYFIDILEKLENFFFDD